MIPELLPDRFENVRRVYIAENISLDGLDAHIYRALDKETGKEVALKQYSLIRGSRQFNEEARVLEALTIDSHNEHVPKLIGIGKRWEPLTNVLIESWVDGKQLPKDFYEDNELELYLPIIYHQILETIDNAATKAGCYKVDNKPNDNLWNPYKEYITIVDWGVTSKYLEHFLLDFILNMVPKVGKYNFSSLYELKETDLDLNDSTSERILKGIRDGKYKGLSGLQKFEEDLLSHVRIYTKYYLK